VVGEVLTVLRADGDVLCRDCRVATSFSTRFRALMGQSKLPPGKGVLLSRTNFIHTHFMRFRIDVVFLDDEMAVVKIAEGLKPWRMAKCRGASAVIELADGAIRYTGLRVGERLALASGEVGVSGEIRVVLSTNDSRFYRVSSFLLSRGGFVVTRGRDQDAIKDLVQKGAVDVVILDASDSLTTAARTARSLEAIAPDVGVVLAVENDGTNGKSSHANGSVRVERVAKWGSFDSVIAAVERSYTAARAGGLT